MAPNTVDALIIGAGPAGLSAALALARQAHTCVVLNSGRYRNDPADYMHLIPGFDNVSPSAFRTAAGDNMLSCYGGCVSMQSADVSTVRQESTAVGTCFEVADAEGKTWTGKKLILASGVRDCLPEMPGYAECWGKSIFHCLFCKGFEQRDCASAGVLATNGLKNVPHALHIARQAAALCKGAVTLYTDGSEPLAAELESAFGSTGRMKVDSRRIMQCALGSGGTGVVVHFQDGSEPVEQGFLVHVPPTEPRGHFIGQLKLETTPSGDIKVSQPMYQTSERGVFAAGDNCSMLKNVPNAIFSGNLAGQGAASQIQAEAHGQKPLFG
ncbi:hypothetical protein MKZ38_000485 [Zalerion maritima]|uniref:FAD/NAD(P)-binding domain-containing protein n=1 Tax=Zalerion maritima TaxID=339359 RepID=A0AAD5RS74_9PEZI|nr:hypothetical protein MKZ38_000485 [Zalerion maritima]